MADIPLYGTEAVSAVDVDPGGVVEVAGVPFGPAGTSSVELPGVGVWEVDHADPSILVGLEVPGLDDPATDAARSPLLLALFGGDGALALLDLIEAPAESPADDAGRRRDGAGPGGMGGGPADGVARFPRVDAARAGRLVVLADLATDERLRPFARLVALAELVTGLDDTPGGALLRPVADRLLGLASELAEETDPAAEAALTSPIVGRIGHLLDALAARAGDPKPVLDLVAALRAASHPSAHTSAGAAATDPFAVARVAELRAPSPVAPAAAKAGFARSEASEEVTGLRWIDVALVEVVVPRGVGDRWVRLRRLGGEGLVVAQGPVSAFELSGRAEVLVEPGTDLSDLRVEVFDPRGGGPTARSIAGAGRMRSADGSVGGGAGRDLDRIGGRRATAAAVRVGREAASAERSGDVEAARRRWSDCASEWKRANDGLRVGGALARTRGGRTPFAGSARLGPLAVDEVDPFAG